MPIKLEATGHLVFQFRIFASRLSCCPPASLDRRPAIRVGPNVAYDVPIFLTASVSVAVFYIWRAARTASANLDEGNNAFALPARPWGRLVAK